MPILKRYGRLPRRQAAQEWILPRVLFQFARAHAAGAVAAFRRRYEAAHQASREWLEHRRQAVPA